jgi:chemotaxis family two-component system sensor kinase Cph1
MPHGHCYLWDPLVLWSHVISDSVICVAYYSIPLILFAFVRKRRDVPFNAIFIIFGVFIMACGTTHLFDVVTVWDPMYRLSAFVKIITAVVSVTAVLMLIPIMPKALALPSLQAANDQLNKTTNDLRRSNAELEQFAYIASHDLQEPLRMVSVYVDLLKERHAKDLDPQAIDYLRRAAAGAERMHLLIASLLAFARIDQRPVSSVMMRAKMALSDALSNLAPIISESHAAITYDDLGDVCMGKTHLTQVFQNLISNALKFRKPDGGVPTVHIAVERWNGQTIISVRDNGIGIDPAHFERIFLVFQRIHDPGRYEGSGIGLASVRKIVERHGGRIWVESTPWVGSVFRISLPDAPEPDGAPT